LHVLADSDAKCWRAGCGWSWAQRLVFTCRTEYSVLHCILLCALCWRANVPTCNCFISRSQH